MKPSGTPAENNTFQRSELTQAGYDGPIAVVGYQKPDGTQILFLRFSDDGADGFFSQGRY